MAKSGSIRVVSFMNRTDLTCGAYVVIQTACWYVHSPAEPEPKRLGRVIAAFGRPSQILFPNVEDFVRKGLAVL
jgi:hypothetical protein